MFARLLILVMVLMPTLATAQTYDGGGPVPVTYVTKTLGTGPRPADSIEPAPIASNFSLTPWVKSDGINFQSIPPKTEKKARFICDSGPLTRADMIIAPGTPIGPHLHHKIGNTAWNENSTYESLRTTGDGTCSGGPINRSAYWFPALLWRAPSGLLRAIELNYATLYYNCGNQTCTEAFPRGFRMITGFDMADPNNTQQRSEIAAHNASTGDNVQYIETVPNGFVGITCTGGTANGIHADDPDKNGKQNSLSKDGVNPTLLCDPNGELFFDIVTQVCWDRKNLTSPNGRGHVRHPVRDNNGNSNVCPDGWGRVAQLEWKFSFPVGPNPALVARYYLSSDRMMPNPAQWFKNGETFHTDAVLAWDPDILTIMQTNCNGIGGVGHECDNGTVSARQRLDIGHISTGVLQGAARFKQIPAKLAIGAYTIQATHGLMMHEHAEDRSQRKWFHALGFSEMGYAEWAVVLSLTSVALGILWATMRVHRLFFRQSREPR